MATKKFAQMRTKSLKALLETASEEDKVAIEAVLAEREKAEKAKAAAAEAPVETPAEAPAETPAFEEETPLTPEEEAALKAAEENGGVNPMYTGRTAERKPKASDEERHALAEKLKAEVVNHRCQAVPFNTAEWVDGYIAGVIEEKRSNKVLLAIKTDDGRRIVKVHDSNLVRILDETIEPEKKTRAGRKPKDASEKIEWTPEAIADEVNEVIGNVGKTVEIEKYRTTDPETGEEKVEVTVGRIMAIVPDKRAQRLLYRISVPTPVEGNPLAAKTMHRVVKAKDLKIAETLDAEGEELNKKYCERREAAATRTSLTPQDRVLRCEENLKKAEEKLQKAQEELEAKKKQLEEAKKELDKYLAAQQGASEAPAKAPAEAPAEEPLA